MKSKSAILFLLCVLTLSPLMADYYSIVPKGTFEERKLLYQEYCIRHPSQGGRDGIFNEIVRLEAGKEVNEVIIRNCIDFIYTGRDCNDFAMGGILHMYYMNLSKKALSPKLQAEMKACILDYKYWWTDARKDKVYRCYHTENHQALCHSAELLAGQLFKDDIFGNGLTGREHIKEATILINQWLEYRFKFGFSEWLSNSYYDVDIMLLCNLYEHSENYEIKQRAGMVLDLLMFDIALNNFRGTFGSTHGRSYAKDIKGGREEATSTITKLVFGVGVYNRSTSVGASLLASTSYRCPKVIEEIATDYSRNIRNLQRHSIQVEDAPLYGVSYDKEPECHLFWGMQEFIHPLVVRTSKRISNQYNVWPYGNDKYNYYIRKYDDEIIEYGKVLNNQLDLFALSEANIETYRTSDYMLSSVQDYRKGARGYQQHIWQASLGCDAVVFTNFPGSMGEDGSPNYWSGNALMPKVTQYKNILICMYNIPANEKRDYTHAYFPVFAFDEIVEKDAWIIARKADGYIALYSKSNPPKRNWEKHGRLYDYVAEGRQNTWICEMGSKKQWGSFDHFVDQITKAKIGGDTFNISYTSPSVGEVRMGWETSFYISNKQVSLCNYPRYENPYCKADFASTIIEINNNNNTLILDFVQSQRMENAKSSK